MLEEKIKLLKKEREALKMFLEHKGIAEDYSISSNSALQEVLEILQKIGGRLIITPRVRFISGGSLSVHDFIGMLRNRKEREDYGIEWDPEGIEGSIKYTLMHEIGETFKVRQIEILTKGISINYSNTFPTDVYGDFLASTLSPVPPEMQSELFQLFEEYAKTGKTQTSHSAQKLAHLTPDEYSYISRQTSTFLNYIKERSLEIVEGLKPLVKSCHGMSPERRRTAYLRFYDEDLESVLENLPKMESYTDQITAVKHVFFEKIRSIKGVK